MSKLDVVMELTESTVCGVKGWASQEACSYNVVEAHCHALQCGRIAHNQFAYMLVQVNTVHNGIMKFAGLMQSVW